MATSRKAWIYSALVVTAGVLCGTASAQTNYPSRPVKIVVAIGPGSATDSFARMLAEALRNDLKGDFIVENKPGAAGTIGGAFIAKAKPDGYTIGVLHSSVVTTAPAITPGLSYDPRKDFTWLGNTVSNPIVLLVPGNSPFKTLEELVAASKKDPEKYTTGIIGMGTHSHFNLELLKQASGAGLTRVPYSGGTGPVITDLLGGQVTSASLIWAGLGDFVRSDKMRVLAATSPLKGFPDVPTFASKGYPQVHLEVFLSVVGPAGMPKEVVDKLVPAIERAVKNPKNAAVIDTNGYRINYEPPAKLAETVSKELDVVIPLARKIGLTVKE
jgi:tripartite-type tricarboxylate transporter receptor subunit TctC